jgi:hypothetical protein
MAIGSGGRQAKIGGLGGDVRARTPGEVWRKFEKTCVRKLKNVLVCFSKHPKLVKLPTRQCGKIRNRIGGYWIIIFPSEARHFRKPDLVVAMPREKQIQPNYTQFGSSIHLSPDCRIRDIQAFSRRVSYCAFSVRSAVEIDLVLAEIEMGSEASSQDVRRVVCPGSKFKKRE